MDCIELRENILPIFGILFRQKRQKDRTKQFSQRERLTKIDICNTSLTNTFIYLYFRSPLDMHLNSAVGFYIELLIDLFNQNQSQDNACHPFSYSHWYSYKSLNNNLSSLKFNCKFLPIYLLYTFHQLFFLYIFSKIKSIK